MVQCKEIPAATGSEDEAAGWEADMIDQYSDCAIRHNKLIQWVEERK